MGFKEYLIESMKRKAGGFPVYIDKSGETWVCLFISNDPFYGGDRPQLPKGHIDPGESVMRAAAREAHEETGIPFEALMKQPKMVDAVPFQGQDSKYMMYVWAFILDKKYPAKKTPEGKGIWLKFEAAEDKIRRDQRRFMRSLDDTLSDMGL